MTIDMGLLVKLGSPPPGNSSLTAQTWSLADSYASCNRFVAMFPSYLGTPWKTAIIPSVSYMVLVCTKTDRLGPESPSQEPVSNPTTKLVRRQGRYILLIMTQMRDTEGPDGLDGLIKASRATNGHIIPPNPHLADLCEKNSGNTSNPPAKIRIRSHCVPPFKSSFFDLVYAASVKLAAVAGHSSVEIVARVCCWTPCLAYSVGSKWLSSLVLP